MTPRSRVYWPPRRLISSVVCLATEYRLVPTSWTLCTSWRPTFSVLRCRRSQKVPKSMLPAACQGAHRPERPSNSLLGRG